MNTKLILATLAGSVFYFLLGWIVYGMLLMDFYADNTLEYAGLMKEMPNLVVLFLSNLFMVFLIAWIFQKWADVKTLSGGFSAGFLIGILFSLSIDLMLYSTMNLYNETVLIIDIIVNAVIIALVGACVGWILGFDKKKAE